MLQVRKSRYRGVDGWMLCGNATPDQNWPTRIFFVHESAARRTRERILHEQDFEMGLEDFEP
jgi:hypothetical protein